MDKRFRVSNTNIVIDVSRMQGYYFTHYKAIKHCLNTYIAIMLSRQIIEYVNSGEAKRGVTDPDVYCNIISIEDHKYDRLLHSLVTGYANEEHVVNEMMSLIEIPFQLTFNLLDDIHDVIKVQFQALVPSVLSDYKSYVDKTVLINVSLINQNTMVLSVKTINKGSHLDYY